MRCALALLLLLTLVPTARAADPVVIPVNTVILKDDSTPPIDYKRRYFKMRSTTNKQPVENQIVLPAPGSIGDPTSNGASGGGATLTVYNAAGSGEASP